MKQLEKYCMTVQCINDVDTYIISREFLDDFLESIGRSAETVNMLRYCRAYVQYARAYEEKIFFAVAHFKNRAERFAWIPVNCYKDETAFHHVCILDSWKCRHCGYIHHGTIVMPAAEHDAVFYAASKNKYPPIPKGFAKQACKKCGRPLQNHILFI